MNQAFKAPQLPGHDYAYNTPLADLDPLESTHLAEAGDVGNF